MTLGQRIKLKRNEKKLTQKELATKLGIDHTTVSKWESDIYEPDTSTLNKLADIFDVQVDWLTGRTDDPTPPEKTPNPQTNIPSWATRKDIRDFKKMLEEDAPVMFDGVPLDEEDKEKVLKVMEAIFWDAKKRNKRKPVED